MTLVSFSSVAVVILRYANELAETGNELDISDILISCLETAWI